MLLRRLSDHVKAQNWTAVALDFIIVVSGILIAFEITSWNEEVQRRGVETRYLRQVEADLAFDLERVDHFIEFYTGQAEAARRVIGVHAAPMNADVAKYYSDVITVLYFDEHHPRYSSLDALLGSGDVALLSNNRILTQLLEINLLYEEVEKLQSHKYDDMRDYLYFRYGDMLDYADAIETSQGAKIEALSADVITAAAADLRINNGLTLAAFNNGLLVEQLVTIRALIIEAKALVTSAD